MRTKLKRVVTCVLAVILIASLFGCSTKAPIENSPTVEGDTETAKDLKDLKVAVILISSASQVTANQGNAIKAHVESLGAQCTLEYFEQNPATQANMIENAIAAGVDILLVQNQSAGDCVAEITKAYEAGITVLIYGDDVPDAKYTYLFAENSYDLGYQLGSMAAAWANENLVAKGEPVVAALGNYSVSPIAVYRHDGFLAALEELVPDIEIVGTYEMAYKQEGITAGENILQAHPDVNLVVGVNDQSVAGVYEVFVAAGLENENIGIFGLDGTDEALYFISQNTMFKGTMSIDPGKVSAELVDMGIAKVLNDPSAPTEKIHYWDGVEINYSNINDYKDKWGPLAG